MTQQQINAMYKVQEHLKEARTYLDLICFQSGEIDKSDFNKCRKMYGLICDAQDIY